MFVFLGREYSRRADILRPAVNCLVPNFSKRRFACGSHAVVATRRYSTVYFICKMRQPLLLYDEYPRTKRLPYKFGPWDTVFRTSRWNQDSALLHSINPYKAVKSFVDSYEYCIGLYILTSRYE